MPRVRHLNPSTIEDKALKALGLEDAHVNSGWFVDDVEKTYVSKVYGHGILTINMTTGDWEFDPY